MKSVLLIDSYYNFYKIHHAFSRNALYNKKGEPTSVIHGFLTMLFGLLQSRSYDLVVVASDTKYPTFRRELDANYKANRPPMPDELRIQINFLLDLLTDLGFVVAQQIGYEADDIIGTCTRLAREKNYRVEILSADKDIMQFVDENTVLINLDKKTNQYACTTPDVVKEKFGIDACQILDYLSLIGDASDNVRGVAGVGPKTATKLINQYHTIEAVYQNLDAINNPTLLKKLTDGKESAFLSKKLITVVTTLPNLDIDDFSLKPVDKNNVYQKLADKECWQILKRLNLLTEEQKSESHATTLKEDDENLLSLLKKAAHHKFNGSDKETAISHQTIPLKKASANSYQREVITTVERFRKVIAIAKQEKCLTFDLETTSLDPITTNIVACVLVIPKSNSTNHLSFYIRFKTKAEDTFPHYKPLLTELLQDETIVKIGHNLKFEYMVLKEQGIQLKGQWQDTMIREYLLLSNRLSYKLEVLIKDYFNVEKATYKELEKDYQDIFEIPAQKLATYTFEDGEYTYDIYCEQKEKLEKSTKKIYDQIDMPLITVISAMERRGVMIDEAYLNELAKEMQSKLSHVKTEIISLAEEDFNINSTKQLQYILFDKLGITPLKKTKTGYSTDSSVLEKLSRRHPIAEKLVVHRQFSKLLNTYIEVLPKLIHPKTGRIHTHYSQTGAATGRLSSNNPNLQNIPIKGEEGKKIRRAFTAPPQHQMVSVDYSQVELRILAKMSGDKNLLEAYHNDKDIHMQTAKLIFAQDEKSITPQQRNIAKTINFSVLYGISAYALSDVLSVTVSEAKTFIDLYFQNYQGVSEYIAKIIKDTKDCGYVSTYYGRQRPIDGLHDSNKIVRERAKRIAFNSVIQGTASDIIKIAMINIDNDVCLGKLPADMVMQVHDELIFYIKEEVVAETIKKIEKHLINISPFNDILQVNVNAGKCWDK